MVRDHAPTLAGSPAHAKVRLSSSARAVLLTRKVWRCERTTLASVNAQHRLDDEKTAAEDERAVHPREDALMGMLGGALAYGMESRPALDAMIDLRLQYSPSHGCCARRHTKTAHVRRARSG